MQALPIGAVMEETMDQSYPGSPGSPSDGTAPSTPTGRPKLKGRKRFMAGLQRMSSSPSLARLARSSSAGYRSGDRASMSCVSLASTSYSPYGNYTTELSNGYSTAPTSIPSTPGPEGPLSSKPRMHVLGLDRPRTATMPPDLITPARLDAPREVDEADFDYFSRPMSKPVKPRQHRPNFSFWKDMPFEIRLEIFRYLQPKEIVRCSAVSKSWHKMCFDGQLWSRLDVSEYYRDISAESLVEIITKSGPFVRDLNLRGCVQLQQKWNMKGVGDACRNLEYLSLEGCKIDRSTLHGFLLQNPRLLSINMSGLQTATDAGLKIISNNCPKLEELNISWCANISHIGIKKIIDGCPNLKELRAGEVRGWEDVELMEAIFERNTLERLVLHNCTSITDESLSALMVGVDNEVDVLTGRPIVPPRRLKHLDLTSCRALSDQGVKTMAHNLPFLEGLQLSKCTALTDDSITPLLSTLPSLTHLDLEELEHLTNAPLLALATSPCAPHLSHLCISYCESVGDTAMLSILKHCPRIATLDMDNTRISDLVLIEAAQLMHSRNRLARGLALRDQPCVGMRIVAFDCAHVTWTGVREILARNAEETRSRAQPTPSYPAQIIQLKCFYNWQPTVEEHTKRVLRGDFVAAARLERKWAEWMMATEEIQSTGGAGVRRRRRMRRAFDAHMDEEGDTDIGAGVGAGRRRRARSGPERGAGCVLM